MLPATIDRDVTKNERLRVAVRILVQGQVQGVGFRPFLPRSVEYQVDVLTTAVSQVCLNGPQRVGFA